ncbi:unnamed protein product [Symbiodinium sp. CCMP2592]|nr:unnamed protein product [Symbiodinium sp. CCMP2592]
MSQVRKSGSNNIYVFLPHRILDPVPADVKMRVHKFWQTTYWNNRPAFRCFMAALTLAMRGENAASLLGKLVVTGQESVQGSRKGMREDVYKKHMSVDKLPEHMPYAIETHLVELRGWKRFEFNTLPRFVGVNEETFDSMFRRSLAVRYKALFMDPEYIQQKIPDAESQGIFPKDPTLKDFLRSKPACLVTLRTMWQFARDHSAADCRNILENYVVGGMDEGLTESCVRESCGLKVKKQTEDPRALQLRTHSTKPAEGTSDLTQAAAAKAATLVLQKQSDEIVSWMIRAAKDWCTAYQMKQCQGKHAWTGFSRQDADPVLKALSENEFMVKSNWHIHKQGLTDTFHPRVSSSKSWEKVVTLGHHAQMTFPELYDCERLRQRMVLQKGRLANIVVFRKAHRTRVDDLKKAAKQGDKTAKKSLRAEQEEQDAAVQALDAHLARERDLLLALQTLWAQDAEVRELAVQCFFPSDIASLAMLACSGQGRLTIFDGFGCRESATVFAYWWQAAEDMCLSSLLDLVADVDAVRKHVSLHFDGVLLSVELVEAVEKQHENKAFVDIAQAQILRHTGFCIVVREKKFKPLQEMLFAFQSESVRVSTIDASLWETLLQPRNCIASSYAYLTDQWTFVAGILQTDVHLPFLVHVHLSFGPYCFAVKVVADGRLEIFYECKVFELTVDAFRDMLSECCEGFSTVFFCVQSAKPIMASSDEQVLDLVAGGPLPQCDLLGGAEDAEANVDVGDQLRDLLQAEVKDLLKSLARFNQSQQDREAAAIDDMNSVYKLLTVRGRSNAVLALRGIKSEASALIADALASSFSSSQRLQVSHIACDCPSPEMLANLKTVCPNLKSLSLDAMHIVMVYEQNHNNRSTKGSRWLATVMNKFRNVIPDCSAESWGPMYTGVEQISYTAEEKRLSGLIVNKDMSEIEAKAVLGGKDPDVPYRTETQFLESMAAICSLFADEMTKTTFAGPTLHRLLVNLTTPAKIQWLFNDTRYRHACKMSQICLLPSGTTSNESLHHEINSWFREIVSMYRPTLEIKLKFFHYVKLSSHNASLHHPLQRQNTQKQMAHRIIGMADIWTPRDWRNWCKALGVDSSEGFCQREKQIQQTNEIAARSGEKAAALSA